MPMCCVKQCGARKTKNQPLLSLHRFPTNETLKRKWIENIGIDNINPQYKIRFVCSMHFDESCFNRTLDVVRLRDGAVPLSSLQISHKTNKLTSTSNCPIEVVFPEKFNKKDDLHIQTKCTEYILGSQHTPDPLSSTSSMISHETNKVVLHERQSTSTSNCPIKVVFPDKFNKKDDLIHQQQEKIKKVTRKYNLLRQKVKSLKEQVRRRNRKIDLFTSIIKDFENKKYKEPQADGGQQHHQQEKVTSCPRQSACQAWQILAKRPQKNQPVKKLEI